MPGAVGANAAPALGPRLGRFNISSRRCEPGCRGARGSNLPSLDAAAKSARLVPRGVQRRDWSSASCRQLGSVGAIEPLQRDLRQLRLHAPLAAAGDGQRRFVRQHLLQRRPKLGFLSRLRLRIGRRGLTGLFEGGDTSDQIGFLGALAIEIRAQPMDLSSP